MDRAFQKVTVSVVPFSQMKDHSISSFGEDRAAIEAGRPHPGARIVFATEELLWETLTPKRLALLKAIGGRGPISIREAARLAGRDVKAVHGDIQRLLRNGGVRKGDDGKIEFPYSEIHLDVTLKVEQVNAA